MNVERIATMLTLVATHLNEIAQELRGAPDPAYVGGDSSAPVDTEAAQPAAEVAGTAVTAAEVAGTDTMPLDKFRNLARQLVERDPTNAPGLIRPILLDMGVDGGIVDVPEHRRMAFLKNLSDAIKSRAGG